MEQNKIEKLVEEKVEEKTEKLVKKVERLEEQNRRLREKGSDESEDEDQSVSRRDFLKKAGMGAMGLGAIAMSPASALNIKDQNLNVQTGSDSGSLSQAMDIDSNGNISIPNGNLQIGTGQTIEDGSGISRLGINGTNTNLNYSNGTSGIRLRDANLIIQNESGDYAFLADSGNYASRIVARNGEPAQIQDRHGGGSNFMAVQYKTSSSAPGTLEMTNANLTFPTDQKPNKIQLYGSGDNWHQIGTEAYHIRYGGNNTGTSSYEGHKFYSAPGELTAQIGSGSSNSDTGETDTKTSQFFGNVKIGANKIQTQNFEITENSSTNSLDFNFTG